MLLSSLHLIGNHSFECDCPGAGKVLSVGLERAEAADPGARVSIAVWAWMSDLSPTTKSLPIIPHA